MLIWYKPYFCVKRDLSLAIYFNCTLRNDVDSINCYCVKNKLTNPFEVSLDEARDIFYCRNPEGIHNPRNFY